MNISTESISRKGRTVIRLTSALFLAHAIGFCLWKFFNDRSLWLDEAFVAINVRGRSLLELFSHLDYDQQFPRPYLAAIWALTRLIGYETWVLRLLPFLFAVAALLFWTKLIWDELEDGPAPVLFTAIPFFLFNSVIYIYAVDLKQYSGDLFWSAFACYVAKRAQPRWRNMPLSRWAGLAAIWTLPIVLSRTYVLVFSAAAVVLMLMERPRGAAFWTRAGVLAAFAGGFLAVSWLTDLRYGSSSLYTYWKDYFIQGDSVAAWARSFWQANGRIIASRIFESRAVFLTVIAYLGLAAAGWDAIAKKRAFPLALVAGGVMAQMLALGALKAYPLDAERLSLFFYPLSVLMVFRGFRLFLEARPIPVRVLGALLLAPILIRTLYPKIPDLTRHVYRERHWEDIYPALQRLDPDVSRYVVYGTASVAQIKAAPRLPVGFSFTGHQELEVVAPLAKTRNPWLEGDFYYLMATPNADLDELLRALAPVSPHSVETLDPHLYLFRATPKR